MVMQRLQVAYGAMVALVTDSTRTWGNGSMREWGMGEWEYEGMGYGKMGV